jgi:hypothetical protein
MAALDAYGAAVSAALQRVAHGEQLYAELVADLSAHVQALAALGIFSPAVRER